MVRKPKPIICLACGKDSGHKYGPILMVIRSPGLKCQHCGYVVIKGSQYEWGKRRRFSTPEGPVLRQALNFVRQEWDG